MKILGLKNTHSRLVNKSSFCFVLTLSLVTCVGWTCQPTVGSWAGFSAMAARARPPPTTPTSTVEVIFHVPNSDAAQDQDDSLTKK